MVGADISGFLKPVSRRLGQNLTLERDRRQDDIEGTQPVCCNNDAVAIRQIIILAHLAIVASWQFGNESI